MKRYKHKNIKSYVLELYEIRKLLSIIVRESSASKSRQDEYKFSFYDDEKAKGKKPSHNGSRLWFKNDGFNKKLDFLIRKQQHFFKEVPAQ